VMRVKEETLTNKVCASFSKLIMIIEFMRKQEEQLDVHLVMSPDLCIGVADTLQIVKDEIHKIASDAQKEIDRLRGELNGTV